MNDCDALLREVMAEAAKLKIPFSDRIDPKVRINCRAATRFGCCIYKEGRYLIEVAQRVAEGPERSCRETRAAPYLLWMQESWEALEKLCGKDEPGLWVCHFPQFHQRGDGGGRGTALPLFGPLSAVRYDLQTIPGFQIDRASGAVPLQMRGETGVSGMLKRW